MLDKYAEVAKVLLLEFNVEKSHCVVIEWRVKSKSEAMKSVWQAFEKYVTMWLLYRYYFYCVALLYIICLCPSLCLVCEWTCS